MWVNSITTTLTISFSQLNYKVFESLKLYLAGDTYFHTAYDDHNLVRCRTQLKMVESMEAQAKEYEEIVRRFGK